MLNFFNVLSILSLCTSICCRMGTEKRPRLENYIYKDLLTKENINIDGIQSVWNMEYWRGTARDEVRHVIKNQKIKGPASLKMIKFMQRSMENTWKIWSRTVIYFIVRPFLCFKCEEWIWKDYKQRQQLGNSGIKQMK